MIFDQYVKLFIKGAFNMSIVKNPTAASIVNRIGNRINKLKGKILEDPENMELFKKLKEYQKTFVVLAKEAYYTFN